MFAMTSLLSAQVSGDAVIRGKTSDSEIVITTTSRVAGAVHSLRWRGKEFIDSTDHGRQLQSALNLDAGSPITNETYNPTEAGSRLDGTGNTSSSQLLSIESGSDWLRTNTRLAFWLAPGEYSAAHLAKNTSVISNWCITKEIKIGAMKRPHLIAYNVVFGNQVSESYRSGVFESLTGYMPAEFSVFFRFDVKTFELKPLSDGPGEQEEPIVFSTPKGDFAMGVYVPKREASSTLPSNRYGRWRFAAEKVVKWNCVTRLYNADGGTQLHFLHYLAVGTREGVRKELEFLSQNGI